VPEKAPAGFRKSILSRYRQLNVWSKIGLWGSLASLFAFFVWLLSPQKPPVVVASPQHYETHGPQSPIMPDNKGSVTISNQPSATSPAKKDERHK
jgi:hypothetical protein